MARRTSFGNTWWGRAWVDALEGIDYNTNRLPRGRRYARNGSVREIRISDGVVYARVKGTRPSPYRVEISLRHFRPSVVKKIKNILAEVPSVVTAVSMGQLPEEVNSLLEAEGISLFPEDWQEIHASCSCPDWANPCKHLAAVYYIIASEIDKDPFLLFNLRGIKTEEITSLAGLSTAPPSRKPDEILSVFSLPREVDNPMPLRCEELPDITLNRLEVDALLELLPEKPSFYPHGNFRRRLLSIYQEIEKAIAGTEILENIPSMADWSPYIRFEKNGNTAFIIADTFTNEWVPAKRAMAKLPIPDRGKVRFRTTLSWRVSMRDLLRYLMRLPSERLEGRLTEGMWFLLASVVVSRILLKQGLFVPEVLFHDGNAFSIRYSPLVYDEKVERFLDHLMSAMPCYIFHTGRGRIIRRDGFMEVFSLILTTMVHILLENSPYTDDPLLETFTTGSIYEASSFEEERTGMAIANYLEGIQIRNRTIMPLIRIDSSGRKNFSLAVDIQRRDEPLSESLPISSIFDDSRREILSMPAEQARTETLRNITILSNFIPELRRVVDSRGRESVRITSRRMAEILTDARQILDILGVRVSLPKGMETLARPRIILRAGARSAKVDSILNISNMLEFSPEIALGKQRISLDEFRKLLRRAEGVVRFRDQYLLLTPEIASSIMQKLDSLPEMPDGVRGLHALLSGRFEGTEVLPDDTIRKALKKLGQIKRVSIPRGLRATLRPYQERGYRWLYTNLKMGFGCCLADDMGLGKTIQVLALIQKLKEENTLHSPALVVCPTTLVGNWQKEAERFTPGLSVYIYHGAERRFMVRGQDIIITTYGLLRRDIRKFTQHKWTMVVADEAQNIKNPSSQQSRALKSLKSDGYIAMTGTPVENHLTELWSIFDFTNRGYLGSVDWFRKNYAVPIEILRDRQKIEELRNATCPFILRRLKTDRSIISDLPEKVLLNEYCHLTPQQAALYQKVLEKTLSAVKSSEGIKRKGLIFKLLTALKQICNHPVHYSGKGNPDSTASGKAEKTVALLSAILEQDEKVLIFTQYREMGLILEKIIARELSETVLFFHGGLQRKKRDTMVTEFQNNPRKRIMIVSLKAGGTGLNLTSATNVIHYDLWWNPAVEDQATDRTYRIGQRQNVMVHRLITVGTFEEKIDDLLQKKRELAELTVSKGEQWITELDDRQLEELLSLRH